MLRCGPFAVVEDYSFMARRLAYAVTSAREKAGHTISNTKAKRL